MQTRIILLIVSVALILLVSLQVTGSFIPIDDDHALIFQGGLLIVVFGSLVFEDKFTKPADAVVNAIAALASLIPVYTPENSTLHLILLYSVIVLMSGLINLILVRPESMGKARTIICDVSYKISTIFGKSNIIFSAVFLYAVLTFPELKSDEIAVLLLFWGVYMVLWPLKIPHLIEAVFTRMPSSDLEGIIVRVDVPNLVKVKLTRESKWNGDLLASLGDGRKHRVLPLYTQIQGEEVIGTGLICEELAAENLRTAPGSVYRRILCGDSSTPDLERPVGIVTEGSRIARLCFETWHSEALKEGIMVFCHIGNEKVYYQVSDALTTQEAFERNRHGFQVVEAHQLGTFHSREGFKKFAWLPEANTPVFLVEGSIQGNELKLSNSEMILGTIPGSDIQIVCDIDEMISHHTAILGVTGSGKTELAFRIVQQAIENDVKVFCVDITGQYINQLKRFNPEELSVDENLADELGQKLHAVETGQYGAGKEKEVLKEFTDCLRKNIDSVVSNFLKNSASVGVFTLRSISNTKATIHATEIYLSSIFQHGREKTTDQRILIVLEEAHTVIPESNTMGLGDYDSRGMVAKIAQIALQGRKYDVGLLVIAQRTATVSKTVLTQCNTVIAFSSFDQTGLAFLSNIYGSDHTSKISNLPSFHVLASGKGIKSERPVIIELPPISTSDSAD